MPDGADAGTKVIARCGMILCAILAIAAYFVLDRNDDSANLVFVMSIAGLTIGALGK
jgi:hypothetical protein